uniref:Uncharacterized protein n=1 Tax=Cuerna arida TaxID=1464854 RepID=A0A1B6FMM3_9HEMI
MQLQNPAQTHGTQKNPVIHLFLRGMATRSHVSKLPDIEEATIAKYLGITFDENLTWTANINLLYNKLSISLFVIRSIKNICDSDTAKIAYSRPIYAMALQYGEQLQEVIWNKRFCSKYTI